MKILLTGSTGFLGSIIKNELLEDNLITLSRTNSDYKISLENEVPDFKEIFDLIIHAAGKAHSVPKTSVEKKQFFDVNVEGTSNLLKGLQKTGIPKQFVFISSVSVYGQNSGKNIDENHPLQAVDPYGLSKVESEKLVINWCKENNIICTILRLPLLVGEKPPGNLGAMINAIDKGYYFNIGNGKAKKSMVLAQDVAAFILKIANTGGIYNLTDGYHPDFYELSTVISMKKNKKTPLNMPIFIAKLAGIIGDLLGEKSPINSSKLKKITSDLTFDDTKARKAVGWNPKKVLEHLQHNSL
ncbi:NAD-dependent epimerase/dehydratase family protein [Flavobacterium hungaricum]|uniref:NAD-dependent epimerase/dehydratase family protein n=1 Tax=Flavobacterium hungaricum TaxID=2082725 RepID=A0ABR9TR08_9FLAO|nr:NAD-dependent epimerase/dehydratase family protein [Flavobacterium hungaricum]MBE8727765.1 NAD-dependent epimerase/dehydratase family protein [Flavobacterium hungaricum]